eukprot:353296-Pyramimonas_sp.AAC.1
MRDQNVPRFRKLASLLASLQLPWIVAADWNFTPASLARTGFLEKVGGQVLCCDSDFTGTPGGDNKASHLDYLVVSAAARPHVRAVRAVCDVPWRPHIGLHIDFVGEASQLFTRILELAPRFPKVARPGQQAIEGSKSSIRKAKREATRIVALEKRNARIQEWFGEALTNEKVEGLSEGEAGSEEEVASHRSLDEG